MTSREKCMVGRGGELEFFVYFFFGRRIDLGDYYLGELLTKLKNSLVLLPPIASERVPLNIS